MKIIFVSHASSFTGAPKVVFELAKLFATQHEVTLVTKRDGPLLDKAIKENSQGINFININNNHEICKEPFSQKVATAKKLIEQHRPDLVYVNSAASGEWVIASKLCGVKNIFHIHEMKDELIALLYAGCVTLDTIKYADIVVFVSKDVEREVNSVFDHQPKKSLIVEQFFDCEKILSLSKIEENLPQNYQGNTIIPNKPIVCACGTATHRKGVDIFFEAAQKLPHLQFLWIGKWYSKDDYKNPIEEQYFKKNIQNFFITGEVENPYFYLNLADLFVLSSREDPNPLIIFEALILGKQVVCFGNSGGSKLVLDRCGYVISGEPRVDLLVSFIERIFPEPYHNSFTPDWLRSMQKRVIDQYDEKKALSKYEKIINK